MPKVHVSVTFPAKIAWGLLLLLFPVLLRAQGLSSTAMSTFPADTREIAYTNLAQLRNSPNYPQIREQLLAQQLRYFQDFVRSMGVNPERDVDEVALGWRGEASGPTGAFGLAAGRFHPDVIQQYFLKSNLPVLQYDGNNLYAFGSGASPTDMCFTFFDSGTAAFGRLADLKALLDVRAGTAKALSTNSAFANWEQELEGTAAQWGILSGKAAANLAAAWFVGGKKPSVDVSTLLGPVRGVLYRVDWEGNFYAHVAVVCQDAQSAETFTKLLTLLQNATQQQPANATSTSPVVNSLLQGVEIRQNGARVEMDLSGPVQALDRILHPSSAG
jgi:hypothetical protein